MISPSFSVIEPPTVTSTILPLPPVTRSLKTFVTVVLAARVFTRLTLTVTASTETLSVSVTNTPPLPANAERVTTVVSRWLLPVPIPPFTALINKPAALTSRFVELSISTMVPLVVIIATLPFALPTVVVVASTSETLMLLTASKRMSPPSEVIVEPSFMSIIVPDLTSMVALFVRNTPVKAVLPVVLQRIMLPLASSEIFPVPPSITAFASIFPLRACMKILPAPVVVIPVVSPPPFTIISVALITISPEPVVISLNVAGVVTEKSFTPLTLASLPTRPTTIDTTVSITSPSVSVTKRLPDVPRAAAIVPTVVSI